MQRLSSICIDHIYIYIYCLFVVWCIIKSDEFGIVLESYCLNQLTKVMCVFLIGKIVLYFP